MGTNPEREHLMTVLFITKEKNNKFRATTFSFVDNNTEMVTIDADLAKKVLHPSAYGNKFAQRYMKSVWMDARTERNINELKEAWYNVKASFAVAVREVKESFKRGYNRSKSRGDW